MFVCSRTIKRSPNAKELWDYIEDHKNKKFYQKMLNSLLQVSKKCHQDKKDEEAKQKLLIKEMKN